ncbi:MAG: TIM barrel protein [Gemmatimonadaceae bacterium]
MDRRGFVRAGAVAGGTVITTGTSGLLACAQGSAAAAVPPPAGAATRIESFHHSVCKWCYRDLSVEQLTTAAKGIGMHSVELLDPEEWPAVKAQGLTCAMVNAPGDGRTRIPKGFNRVENHAWLVPLYLERIPLVAHAGLPNLICFSGNRGGIGDEEGLENCERGLRAIMPAAEQHGVTVCMELLNSKVDHHDYQCDHTPWGVALVKRVGSERFKLLYDIYHMQIMEGDVIRTIRDNHQHIAHYHTGGVPGRHEIDDSQELYYPAVMRAIRDTGFRGYVAQEFIPTRDPVTSLAQGVQLCRV